METNTSLKNCTQAKPSATQKEKYIHKQSLFALWSSYTPLQETTCVLHPHRDAASLAVSELLACIGGIGRRHQLMGDCYPSSLIVLLAQLLCHLHQCCRTLCVLFSLCAANAMTSFLCSPSSSPKITLMDTHHFCMLCSTDPRGTYYLPGAEYQQSKLLASPQP